MFENCTTLAEERVKSRRETGLLLVCIVTLTLFAVAAENSSTIAS